MMKVPEFLDECKKANAALEYVDEDTVIKKILPPEDETIHSSTGGNTAPEE
jgi:hypothetical protein